MTSSIFKVFAAVAIIALVGCSEHKSNGNGGGQATNNGQPPAQSPGNPLPPSQTTTPTQPGVVIVNCSIAGALCEQYNISRQVSQSEMTQVAQQCSSNGGSFASGSCPSGAVYGRCVFPASNQVQTTAFVYRSDLTQKLQTICQQNGGTYN
jgi:hypothetical protein